MNLGTIGRLIRAVLIGVVLAVLLFPVFGWIGSSIPRNGASPPAPGGVEIMVETNGTHTGIVMPVVTPEKDWRESFPSARQLRNGETITHVAVGWGEREVFLDTPTWGDLKASTAARIALVGGEPIMRVSHYLRPMPGENHRPLVISRADYARMVAAIEASLDAPEEGGAREILRGVDPAAAYYRARGHYTLAQTCNSWVGDMLAEGGVQIWAGGRLLPAG